jgi:hypothetical protein
VVDRDSPRLRLGLIIDRDIALGWHEAVVHEFRRGDDVEIALIVFGSEHPPAPRPRPSPYSLWRLYNNGWVARRAASARPGRAWSEIAPDTPRIDVDVERRGRWSQHVAERGLEAIRSFDLDVLFRFGLGIIRGDILDAARYGVWSFHHDDERVIRGGPPAFWEVFDGLATSGVLLQRLTDRLDGGIPLARATFRTVAHSYPRNRDRVFLGAAVLPARTARAVRTGALDPDAIAPSRSDAPIRKNPAEVAMLRFFARQTRRAVTERARDTSRADRWSVSIVDAPHWNGEGDVHVIAADWVPELAPHGYLADPFAGHRDGRTAIMVEEFDEATARGVISAVVPTSSGWQLRSGVIDTGVHASYPFLVEADGELYCVPESWQADRVEAWRCIEFPEHWERSHVLVDEPVVDPTVFRRGESWWLLGTLKHDEPDAKLFAWSAAQFGGPWHAHPLNPLKIDVRSSRPAGTPFIRDGALYRPAQDCSRAYGSAVVLNRVVALDERGLEEESVGRVVPPGGRYASGTHTLATFDDLWTIDGRRYGWSRHRFGREVRARLNKLRGAR